MLNLDTTMAQREGVGEKREQLMTRTSISLGETFAFLSALSTMSKMIISASFRLPSMDRSGSFPSSRHWTMPGGQAVACPVPERARRRRMKSRLSSVKHFCRLIISIICSCDTFHSSGALKVAKDMRKTGLSIRRIHPMTTSTKTVTLTAGSSMVSPAYKCVTVPTALLNRFENKALSAIVTAEIVSRENSICPGEAWCSTSLDRFVTT
mmetsp:Transcript_8000/g.14413  ORF Transcript_8000/g.14413 Transcript_8000/m.14413 type:complete len:209 (-) Transcript_8000:388-1014(-)